MEHGNFELLNVIYKSRDDYNYVNLLVHCNIHILFDTYMYYFAMIVYRSLV